MWISEEERSDEREETLFQVGFSIKIPGILSIKYFLYFPGNPVPKL